MPVHAAMVRELDEPVATVLAALENSGGRDNTLVIFTSDPGECRDLSDGRKERAGQLRVRLAAWRESVQAVLTTPNPQPVEPFGPDAVPGRKAG